MDHPTDQDGIEVAEMSRDHDDRPFFCKLPQHFYLADNRDLVPQRVTAAKEGPEFFYPRAVKQSRKPKLGGFTRETVGTGFKVAGDFIGIAEDNQPEDLFFFLARLIRRPGTQFDQLIFDFGPKFILIRGVRSPTVPLHPVLLAVNGSLKLLDQPLAGW